MVGSCLAGPDRDEKQLEHVHESAVTQVLQTPKLRLDRRLRVRHELAYFSHGQLGRAELSKRFGLVYASAPA